MSTCDGCGAPVQWRHNDRTGNRAPVSPEPDPEGNVVLVGDSKYHVLSKDELARIANPGLFDDPPPVRYRLHWASCPYAQVYRRRCARCRQAECVCPTSAKAEHVKGARQTRDHTCHWPGCERQVKPAQWGCMEHWRRLPKHLRDRIWKAYRPGQEDDVSPSREYVSAAHDVQEWIRRHG